MLVRKARKVGGGYVEELIPENDADEELLEQMVLEGIAGPQAAQIAHQRLAAASMNPTPAPDGEHGEGEDDD